MSLLEKIELAHLPPEFPLYIALFSEVKNAAFLRQQLLDGNSSFEYAFIDATTVISTTHVLTAAFRALNDCLNNRLRSRNVHSEIVFALGPNNNIAQSLTRFGITPSTSSLLAIKVGDPSKPEVTAESVSAHLHEHVEGKSVLFSDEAIAGMTDWAEVMKLYKLGNMKILASGVAGKQTNGAGSTSLGERQKRDIEVAIMGTIALRGS